MRSNLFYGIIVIVLAILMFGSMKYYGKPDAGEGITKNKSFGITHEWTQPR